MQKRNALFDQGKWSQKEWPIHTISLGNLSFGGTGKTPFCYELVKYCSEHGLKVGILSRGYKSNFEQSCAFFSSLNHSYSAKDIGDEPLMLANKFKEALAIIPNMEVEFTQPIEMRFNELISGVIELYSEG